MEIIVQKFGGTSVSTPENREYCLKHIKEEMAKGKKSVVVVSAMGRKGDSYATDTLLSLLGPNSNCGDREKDMLMSTGEIISAVVFSSYLKENGIDNVVLTGGQAGIITSDSFGSALILDVMPNRIKDELSKGRVVIVPGFQGQTISGEVTTLGRGGSDTTAAALGAALEAEYVDIYTDVEGMMTADPRIVENARYIEAVSYEDVAQMAWCGAKVVHPRAVELAMNHEIPMRIRSTFSDKLGTEISKRKTNKNEYDAKETMISGVVSNGNIHRYEIQKGYDKKEKDTFKIIFSFLKDQGISIDFINITSETAFFTVTNVDSMTLESFLIENNIDFKKEENVSKVSVVGSAICGVPGVMSTIVETLSDWDIEVLQTSDSNTTIWLLVNESDEKNAVKAIHDVFFSPIKKGVYV